MQEIDAERRIQILRGEIPTPVPEVDGEKDDIRENRSYGSGRERKRRKKAGEKPKYCCDTNPQTNACDSTNQLQSEKCSNPSAN